MKFITHEAHGDQQHHALQDDEIAGIDRADQKPADPRQRKDRFDDHRAADQSPDIDSGDRDQRQRRRFQRMHEQDARRLQSLGLGQRDIVFLQGRDHVGAQHAHDPRPFGQRQCQRRQHHEAQIAGRVFGERHVAGRRQPAQFDREQIDQQDRGQEGRHRQHAEGAAGHEAVERRRRCAPRRRSPGERRSQGR